MRNTSSSRQTATWAIAAALTACWLAGGCSGALPAAEPEAAGGRFALQHSRVLSEKGSTRGTGYIESNKILTLDGKVHVTWIDAGLGGTEPARIQTLDLASGEWSPVYTLGEATDNHGSPTIVCDNEGYLHVVFGGHGPVKYRRSVRPNDASQWTDAEELFDGTYLALVCDAGDSLHLVSRVALPEKRKLVYYRREANGQWSDGRPLVEPTPEGRGYRCYRASLYLDGQQRLHLAFMLFPGTAYKNAVEEGLVGYMRSDDGGDTWTQFDGTPVDTPTDSEFDRVPVTENSIRVSNLVVDSDGVPYVVPVSTGFSGYHEKWGAANLWKRTPDGWRPTPLNPLIETAYPGHRASWAEPSLTLDDDGNLYIALVAVDVNEIDPQSKWINEPGSIYGHVSSKIVVLVSADRGETFELLPMQQFGSGAMSWLPSFERQTGYNRVPAPGLIYTRGMPGVGCKPEDAVSDVVFYRFEQK